MEINHEEQNSKEQKLKKNVNIREKYDNMKCNNNVRIQHYAGLLQLSFSFQNGIKLLVKLIEHFPL